MGMSEAWRTSALHFGVLGGHLHQVSREHRFGEQHASIRVARRQYYRRASAIGVVEGADAVGQAAGDVDVGEGRPSAGPGIAIGHPYGGAFLQCLNVLYLRIVLQPVPERGFRWYQDCRRCARCPRR